MRRIKTYDNEWQIKNEVNGFDHVYQRGNRRFIGWFIIYHLAGTLFLVVSVHSLLLLGHGHGDDFLPRPRKNVDVTVTMYMLVRLCKFTLAFVFLWMYAAFVGQQLKTFGFTLMLFYFIYLGLETYILYLFEKKRMKREKREKDDEYNQR